jgi:glycerol-3-phosphate dehydrogenase
MLSRSDALEMLAGRRFDLLVVGAGIVGSRVAYEAAQSGLSVALVDAGDFGGATSSASSKLVHGGLRYLGSGDLRLVRESQTEKSALLRLAPGLVHRLPFMMAIYRHGQIGSRQMRAGLMLYGTLSGFREVWASELSPAAAAARVPGLRTEDLEAGWLYEEGQTNDGRLTLATVKGAAEAGAVVLNHAAVVELGSDEAVVEAPEGRVGVGFRAAVNASGPWVDHVRRLEDPGCVPLVRLSKGVHLLLPLPAGFDTAVSIPLGGTRATFAVPWEGMLLLGTTDTGYEGDAAAARVEPADVDMVLGEAALMLGEDVVRRDLIRHTYAGLRALPAGPGETARASREHFVNVGPQGLVSIAGGKLTTHRRIAIDVLRELPERVRPRGLRPSNRPLPGFAHPPQGRRPADVEPASWSHLIDHYGSEVDRLLAYGAHDPEALGPIAAGGPDVWAQACHAVENEWAVTAEDVLRRRTTVSIRGLGTPEVEARVDRLLAGGPGLSQHG